MFYSKGIETVLESLGADRVGGLTNDEAAEKMNKYGPNKLAEPPKQTIFSKIFTQINDALIYVLLAAAVVTFIVGEHMDSYIILAVVAVNAAIGLSQELKAEKAVEALKKLSSPNAEVIRNGEHINIKSEQLVPGDIVVLTAGGFVPADIRLIETAALKIDESMLTGESVPAEKDAGLLLAEDAPLGDRLNCAYMSSVVTYGRGLGVVTGTGMNTEMGDIAQMLGRTETITTPLQENLDDLGGKLGYLALGVCGLIMLIGFVQGRPLFELFITAISLAVAAIPEGLAAIVAIVLAIGSMKMTQKNAVVKKLAAIETLGSIDMICSDKTGTLTQNKMEVMDSFGDMGILTEAMVLASDAAGEDIGDPTETALIKFAAVEGADIADLRQKNPRHFEIPFDSGRKMMSVVVGRGSGGFRMYTKGAAEGLMGICSKYLENGEIMPLTDEKMQELLNLQTEMSERALRVLAAAYRDVPAGEKPDQQKEQDLIFIGFVGMIDPPREGVAEQIAAAKGAGITTKMITGDHKITALAIARDLGIANTENEVITGDRLQQMPQPDLEDSIDRYHVFARVSPEHKVRILKAARAKGHIVSMTGDGVNDAPALKSADIGVAMGITGTDVAKSSSDMILTDDNFSTIVRAIEEGRNIYNNIKKAVVFLLTCNLGEVMCILASMILFWPVPLVATQILWINLVTDSLPAIALGVDSPERDIMTKLPRGRNSGFFGRRSIQSIITGGLTIGLVSLVMFYTGYKTEGAEYGRTLTFVTLAVAQLFYAFTMRSQSQNAFRTGLFGNSKLLLASGLGILMQVGMVYIPFTQKIFKLVPVHPRAITMAIVLAVIPSMLHDIIKDTRKGEINV